MRLSEQERQTIVNAVVCRDPAAEIYLFGSRVDDAARGGDIDLLVLSGKIGFSSKLDILVDLFKQLGDRKLDLVVEANRAKPFTRIAIAQGVRL